MFRILLDGGNVKPEISRVTRINQVEWIPGEVYCDTIERAFTVLWEHQCVRIGYLKGLLRKMIVSQGEDPMAIHEIIDGVRHELSLAEKALTELDKFYRNLDNGHCYHGSIGQA